MEDSRATAALAAECLGISPGEVLVESTGVIGQRIKMDEFTAGIPALAANLRADEDVADAAATAICTTDLVRKTIAVEVDLGGGRVVRIGGMGKGSGMIHPNMATMLGVVTCDAPIGVTAWRAMVKRACQNSYNQISVDGDTSTNDTVIAFASGAAGGDEIAEGPRRRRRSRRRSPPCASASPNPSRGMERAPRVSSSVTSRARLRGKTRARHRAVRGVLVAREIRHLRARSQLGRLAAAAGYSGVDFEQTDVRLQLGPHLLMEKGQPLDFDAEAAAGTSRTPPRCTAPSWSTSPSATDRARGPRGDVTSPTTTSRSTPSTPRERGKGEGVRFARRIRRETRLRRVGIG